MTKFGRWLVQHDACLVFYKVFIASLHEHHVLGCLLGGVVAIGDRLLGFFCTVKVESWDGL